MFWFDQDIGNLQKIDLQQEIIVQPHMVFIDVFIEHLGLFFVFFYDNHCCWEINSKLFCSYCKDLRNNDYRRKHPGNELVPVEHCVPL